jgi:hypothetical protein
MAREKSRASFYLEGNMTAILEAYYLASIVCSAGFFITMGIACIKRVVR